MHRRFRSPFVFTFAAAVAGCGATPEAANPEPTDHDNPPRVVEVAPPGNPPPLVSACPEAGPPEVGQGCTGELSCHYGSSDPCDSTWMELRCVNGTFEVGERPTCNPPPPPSSSAAGS